MGRETGHGGRCARWVLLACTLFGLATMHTLGHAGLQVHAHHDHAAQAAAALLGPLPVFGATNAAATSVASGVCDGGCAHPPGPSRHGGMSSWSVCLAVLGALVALLLLTMLIGRSRGRGPAAPETGSWAVVSRGPPARLAGLAVSAVSVLRI